MSGLLERLNELNDFTVFSVYSKEFSSFGRVYDLYNRDDILHYLNEKTIIPAKKNIYVGYDEELTALDKDDRISYDLFGGGEIQLGYCNGNSFTLSALEWHACPELGLSTEPIVLFLAERRDITNGRISSDDVRAFLIPEGVAFELYAGVLHFAPCKTSGRGFKCLVGLTRGTNTPLDEEVQKSFAPLRMRNKWMLCHAERGDLIAAGAVEGIDGENLTLKF